MAEYFALAVRQISEYSGRSGGGYQEKPYDRSWPVVRIQNPTPYLPLTHKQNNKTPINNQGV